MSLRVPRRFQSARMAQLNKRQFSSVFDYLKNLAEEIKTGRGLLLSGPPGVGKSHAIVALTYAVSEKYSKQSRFFDYEFITAADMFDKYPLWREKSDDEEMFDKRRNQPWKKTAHTVKWLVINDLAKEFRGGQMKEQAAYKLGRILRERTEKMLVTHVTTNARPKEIKAVYGESIASLLSEMCSLYEVNGRDRRKSNGAE